MKTVDKLLVTPKNLKPSFENWLVMGVLNPAAIRLPNNKIMLYARVAEQSHLHGGKLLHCPVVAKGKKAFYEDIRKTFIKVKGSNNIILRRGKKTSL